MARYFFDNSSTSGFGTLTGAWDTTSALWTLSSLGNTGRFAVTSFTDQDIAQFGWAYTASTAGTVTIASGLTVRLNAINTNQNSAQIVNGPGSLRFAGTAPNIDANVGITINAAVTLESNSFALGNDGGTIFLSGGVVLPATQPTLTVGRGITTVNSALTGTAGFTKAGAGALYFTNQAGTSDVRGTVTISNDIGIYLGQATGVVDQLKNVGTFNFTTQNAFLAYLGTTAHVEDAVLSNSASGYGRLFSYNAGGITFSDASVGTYTGAFQAATDATYPSGKIVLNNFPEAAAYLALASYASGATATTTTFTFTHSAPKSTSANVLIAPTVASATGQTAILEDNGTGASTFNGTVNLGGGAGSAATLRLTGTNASSTISGVISNSVGTLSLNKQGTTGKWILSGANTYTGVTTVSAGTLVAANASALGAAASTATVTVSSGATLEVENAINRPSGALALTGTGLGANNGALRVRSGIGSVSYTATRLELGGAATIRADTDTVLNLFTSASWTGAQALTIDGGGWVSSHSSGTNAHPFTGLTIKNGTTYGISYALNNAGAAGALGNATAASAFSIGDSASTGTFRWFGAEPTATNRAFTIGKGGCTFEASGTATGAVVTFNDSATASVYADSTVETTITLTGTGGTAATPNVMGRAFAKNSPQNTVLSKTGSGAWRMSAAHSSDVPVTVVAGSLDFNGGSVGAAVSLSGTGVVRNAVLSSTDNTKPVTCSSGTPEIVAKSATNSTTTAPTNITGGVLKLSTDMNPQTSDQGRVLGTGQVTVSAGAGIKTSSSTPQYGRMRYGNLTFNGSAGSPATLYIGG